MEDALRLAERFTRRYDDLLRAFQAEMLNTTSLLDQLNSQFGWVSRLANITQGTDGFLQVTTVSPTGAAARSEGSSPVPLSPGRAGGHGKWVRGRKKRLCARPAALGIIAGCRAGCQGEGPARGLTRLSLLCLPPLQVLSKAPNLEDPSSPPDTQVTVQLFDSEPLSLTVPGDISWEDPRFMEIVAEQALQHYKQNTM